MKKILVLLILISGLIYSFSAKNESELSATISINQDQNLVFQLPEKENDWFDIKFSFTIKNTGSADIKIADPNSYKIFPHPWIVKLNGEVARKWSGSPMCAPSFSESDKIQIKPGESKEFEFYLSSFSESFTRVPGKHELSIKYQFECDTTWTMGADKNGLSEVETEWSNKVEIEIKQ